MQLGLQPFPFYIVILRLAGYLLWAHYWRRVEDRHCRLEAEAPTSGEALVVTEVTSRVAVEAKAWWTSDARGEEGVDVELLVQPVAELRALRVCVRARV